MWFVSQYIHCPFLQRSCRGLPQGRVLGPRVLDVVAPSRLLVNGHNIQSQTSSELLRTRCSTSNLFTDFMGKLSRTLHLYLWVVFSRFPLSVILGMESYIFTLYYSLASNNSSWQEKGTWCVNLAPCQIVFVLEAGKLCLKLHIYQKVKFIISLFVDVKWQKFWSLLNCYSSTKYILWLCTWYII